MKKNTVQASQVSRKKNQGLEIVPVGFVVRFNHPRITCRRNDALDATALRPPAVPFTCSAHLRNTPRPVLLRAFRHARRERYMRMCAWLDDLVFAMIRGGNALGGSNCDARKPPTYSGKLRLILLRAPCCALPNLDMRTRPRALAALGAAG